jgi:hypothetical protein
VIFLVKPLWHPVSDTGSSKAPLRPSPWTTLTHGPILIFMYHATILWGLFPQAALFLVAVALAVSTIGFKRGVYFISIGYGFSIAAMSAFSLTGAALLGNWLQWLLAAFGYACIVLVMIGFARRLELKQWDRYGADPDFQAYASATPIFVPLIPIHSLKNAKFYLGYRMARR